MSLKYRACCCFLKLKTSRRVLGTRATFPSFQAARTHTCPAGQRPWSERGTNHPGIRRPAERGGRPPLPTPAPRRRPPHSGPQRGSAQPRRPRTHCLLLEHAGPPLLPRLRRLQVRGRDGRRLPAVTSLLHAARSPPRPATRLRPSQAPRPRPARAQVARLRRASRKCGREGGAGRGQRHLAAPADRSRKSWRRSGAGGGAVQVRPRARCGRAWCPPRCGREEVQRRREPSG